MAPPQWAYQVENFVNEPDEEFVCSICRAIFCDPVVCPCDHVFCRVCISKWLQNNRNCPICRKRVLSSAIKQVVCIINNLIMKLVLNCHNKTLGCTAQFPLESCEAHMKECQYELVQCKNKPCKDRLFRKDIGEHETSDCPHRYIKCKTCGSKITTSALPENHDCIRALQLRIRNKNVILRNRKEKIKVLRNKNKALKAASRNSRHSVTSSTPHDFAHRLTSTTLTSLSPEEIMINIAELESSSLSSDSDDSSENSIIIFTNSPLDNSDDNVESESFSTYMDNEDSLEYPRNSSPHDANEYRNAESQTLDDSLINEQQNFQFDGNGSNSLENDSIEVETAESLYQPEGITVPRRPVKRRPTTQKPAKRRLPPPSPSSSDDDESKHCPSLRSSKRCWRLQSTETESRNPERSQGDSYNSYMEAGPSSAFMPIREPMSSVIDNAITKLHFNSQARLNQKHVQEGASATCGNAVRSSNATIPSGNAVFERTLALLEQYNLESDPEWLPEYASHRGNDTTTESDSSNEAEFVDDSSSSDFSDSDSNNEDDSNTNPRNIVDGSEAVTDFMHWMFDSTSEDDPDWQPLNYPRNSEE